MFLGVRWVDRWLCDRMAVVVISYARWRNYVEDSGLTGDDVQCLAVITFSSVTAGFIIRTRGIQTTQRKRGW